MKWDDIASWWNLRMGEDGDWFNNALIKPYIIETITSQKVNKDISVLDIGCGNGFLCRECAKHNIQVVGIDSSEQMIKNAKQYATNNIKYYVADATKTLPFQRYFDYIIINNVLQDTEDISSLLSNVRVLCDINTEVLITIRHPCFHPKQAKLGWKLKGKENDFFSGQGLTQLLDSQEEVEGLYFAMDDYFGEIQNERCWETGTTSSFNRTITTYVRTFLCNDFKIIDVFEPIPKRIDHCVANLAARVPVFIIFKLRI